MIPSSNGGGVCAIEMVLWDIGGKVYDAPAYAKIGGGKFRDQIRIHAHTKESKDPKIYAQRNQSSEPSETSDQGE